MPNQVEEIAAKGMGKAKAGKAAIKGLRGVFVTLAEQHGEASVLLKRCKAAKDPAKRAELWSKIRAELLSHEKAEMKEVYSVLHEQHGTKTLANHHDAEAQTMEKMIKRLDDMDVASKEWVDLFAKLADTVEHHAEEEEGDIFPRALDLIGEEEAKAMEAPFEKEKKRVMKEEG